MGWSATSAAAALLDPVHKEPPQFDLYAITFKKSRSTSGNAGNPWIDDIVYRDRCMRHCS